jgi:DNA-binding NarL/FixJ family response regulator
VAAVEAQIVLNRTQLPPRLGDQALNAYLHALTGLGDERASLLADTVLAAPERHAGHTVVAALVTRALIWWEHGRIGEGLALLRDAARHGSGISPVARHVEPLLALAAALVDLRQLDEAEAVMPAGDHPALAHLPARAVLSVLRARIHLARGQLDDAVAAGEAGLATSQATGALGYAATSRCVLGVIFLRRGDLAAAAQHLANCPAPGPQFPDIYARCETTMVGAQIIEARDGPAAAIGHLYHLDAELSARPGLLLADPTTPAWLVRTALAAGETELAACAAQTARDLARAHPEFVALAAAAAHSQGLTEQNPGRLAQAATQHPDPWAKASAAEDLGLLHLNNGDQTQAIHQLKEALADYRLVGAERDQARIRSRLRKLGIRGRHWTTPPARPIAGWGSLTDTEQAVALLVAEGLNNKQVAARIYISVHTVAHHLRQAFRKLQIASRVELTRIVIEQAALVDRIADSDLSGLTSLDTTDDRSTGHDGETMAPTPLDRSTIAGAFQVIARADLAEVLDVVESLSPPDKGRLSDRLFKVQSHLGLTLCHN